MNIYNKLIRDKIPEIMDEKGIQYEIRELGNNEYFEMLNRKMQEELNEYNEDHDISELADLVEVAYAILKYKGISVEEFESIRLEKQKERGAFHKKLLLISTD